MLLHSFMQNFMQPSVESHPDAEVAYIAQHPLIDQMPSLLSDFDQPDLMSGTAMQMNAWIGTKGTVTPLHFDSYDNFLAQVGRALGSGSLAMCNSRGCMHCCLSLIELHCVMNMCCAVCNVRHTG